MRPDRTPLLPGRHQLKLTAKPLGLWVRHERDEFRGDRLREVRCRWPWERLEGGDLTLLPKRQ